MVVEPQYGLELGISLPICVQPFGVQKRVDCGRRTEVRAEALLRETEEDAPNNGGTGCGCRSAHWGDRGSHHRRFGEQIAWRRWTSSFVGDLRCEGNSR